MRKSPKQRNPSIIHHPQVRKRLGPGTSLAALSGDHFNRAPDDFTRANLTGANLTGANLIGANLIGPKGGTMDSHLEGLRKLSNAAFVEGEYAA